VRLRAGRLSDTSCTSAISVCQGLPNDVVEVMCNTAGPKAPTVPCGGLLQIRLQARTFLQEMIPHQDMGDGVESHAQQARSPDCVMIPGLQCVEAEDFSRKNRNSPRSDACPAAQAGGGKVVFVRDRGSRSTLCI